MSKFRWDGAAGDDAPELAKKNWLPDLPPPPKEVYPLCNLAEQSGLWLKWARDPVALNRFGSRYRLVRPGTDVVVHAADDLEGIRRHLLELEGAA